MQGILFRLKKGLKQCSIFPQRNRIEQELNQIKKEGVSRGFYSKQEELKELNQNRVLVTGGWLLKFVPLRPPFEGGARFPLCWQFLHGFQKNIVHLLRHPYFEDLRHDITFPLYVERDEIYNLGCPASPIHYQQGHRIL